MRYTNYAAPPIRYDWETGLYSRWYIEAMTDEALADAFCKRRTAFVLRFRSRSSWDTRRIAALLRAANDRGGLAGVIGPDEFAVTLADTDRSGVNKLLYDIAQAMNIAPEVGVAEFPGDGLTFEALIRAAVAELELPLAS